MKRPDLEFRFIKEKSGERPASMNIWVVVRSGRPLILGGATTPLFIHADAPWPDLAQGAKRTQLFPTRPARALSLCSGFELGAGASASGTSVSSVKAAMLRAFL